MLIALKYCDYLELTLVRLDVGVISGAAAGSARLRRRRSGPAELPCVRGQGRRPGVPGCDGAGAAQRSYPASEVRGGSREELPQVQGAVAARAQEG